MAVWKLPTHLCFLSFCRKHGGGLDNIFQKTPPCCLLWGSLHRDREEALGPRLDARTCQLTPTVPKPVQCGATLCGHPTAKVHSSRETVCSHQKPPDVSLDPHSLG